MAAVLDQTFINAGNKLQQLESIGAEQNQPFLFNYCKKLIDQAQQDGRHSASLVKKMTVALDQLQQAFDEAKIIAQQQISDVLKNDINDKPQLDHFFNSGDFKAISRRYSQFNQGQAFYTQTLMPINALTHSLNLQSEQRAKLSQSENLDSYLQQVDHDLFDSLDINTSEITLSETEPLILQSVQLFKQSQQQFNVTQLVQQAIADSPDKPGPLNPHMLAIRSLTLMQDLSPKYMERFISYIDNLLWLEQGNEKLLTKKKP